MKKIIKSILLMCCSLIAVRVQAHLLSEDFEAGLSAFFNDGGDNTDWAVAIGLFHDGTQSVYNPYFGNDANPLF